MAGPSARDVPFAARWRAVDAPDGDVMQVLQLPLSLTLAAAVFALWALLTPLATWSIDGETLIEIAVLLPALHAAMRGATWGDAVARLPLRDHAWPRNRPTRALPGSRPICMARRRYLATLALPLVTLSLAPTLVAALFGRGSADVLAFSVFNALASGGDALAAIVVLTQVPAAAVVRGVDGDIAALAWRLPP